MKKKIKKENKEEKKKIEKKYSHKFHSFSSFILVLVFVFGQHLFDFLSFFL